MRRLRSGELIVLAGIACVIGAAVAPWYDSASGHLSAWQTFGPAVALVLASAVAALVLVAVTVADRSVALPIATAVWNVPLALAAVVSAIVRTLERPDHATGLAAGGWLALAGAVLILTGVWQSMRDERTSLYEPADPVPRPRP